MAVQTLGSQYFLTVEDNVVLGTNVVVGPPGQQKKPNWKSCEFPLYKEVRDLLDTGIYRVMLSRHGYVSKEYDLERYREYAFNMVADAKKKALQTETIKVEGNDLIVSSSNLLALCCSVLSDTPIYLEDKDELECVKLNSMNSKEVMHKYIETISRQNKRFCSINKRIKKSTNPKEIQSALKTAGFREYL